MQILVLNNLMLSHLASLRSLLLKNRSLLAVYSIVQSKSYGQAQGQDVLMMQVSKEMNISEQQCYLTHHALGMSD